MGNEDKDGANGGGKPKTTSAAVSSWRTKYLRQKLLDLGNDIKSIRDQGNKAVTDPAAKSMFKVMLKTLDEIYRQFSSTRDQLMELYFTEGRGSEFPSERDEKAFHSVKQYYYESLSRGDEVFSETASTHNVSALNQTQATTGRIRLPQLNIPHFSGELADWPLFRNAFKSMIHDDPTLSNIEKFHFLIGSLSGHALATVRSVPLLEANYQLAWDSLHQMFDNKRRLASCYLHKLLNFKPLTGPPTVESLKTFVTTIGENITAFQNLGIPNALQFVLFELSIRCLDSQTRDAFEWANIKTDYPTFESLMMFVRDKCHALAMRQGALEASREGSTKTGSFPSPNRFQPKSQNKTHSTVLIASADTSKSKNQGRRSERTKSLSPQMRCKICTQPHRIRDCPTYTAATTQEKISLVKKNMCCWNCLHPGHAVKNCPSKISCQKCQRRHHTTLHHGDQINLPSTENRTSLPSSDQPSLCNNVVATCRSVLLGTAKALIRTTEGRYEPIRMVIDSGSQHSLITLECSKRLGLQQQGSNQTIVGVGASHVVPSLGIAACHLKPRLSDRPQVETWALIVPNITKHLPQKAISESIEAKYKHFNLADPEFGTPGPIEFLLGADLYTEVVVSAPITISPSEPKLINTIFGHIVLGKICAVSDDPVTLACLATDEVDHLIKRFWEVEEVSFERKLSPTDQYCEDHFLKTHRRTELGRYVVSLPFKEELPKLGPSRQRAVSRLLHLEANLCKKPILKEGYQQFMREYLDLGHMEKASVPGRFYLPHHGVQKIVDEGIKLRVVFDASSKTSNGSLNDYLFTGPKLQADIADILLRFRLHVIAFTADIKKMYRQILVQSPDRSYQHILWRENPELQIEEFELNTLTYGLSCAPFLALRVVQQLAKDEGAIYPKAASAISTDIYVDDVVTGAPTEEEALDLKNQLCKLMEKGGLPLDKWASNSSLLLSSVSEEQPKVNLSEKDNHMIKILGLQWNSSQDTFSYTVQEPSTAVITKRTVLSVIARIYDPLGFLAPVIFTAKRILQEIWLSKRDWDEDLPEPLHKAWTTFIAELSEVKGIEIPRCVVRADAVAFDVVGFADASEKGFCGVLYLRVTSGGNIQSWLLKAKTKLAPLNPLFSVPRLELCGALLLAKLYQSCIPFFEKLPIRSVRVFSDSTIVLAWLKTPPHRLNTFVANRVVQISQLITGVWEHVASGDNPADLGSRGVLPTRLASCTLWWTGPSWLSKSEHDWPTFGSPEIVEAELPELRKGLTVSMINTSEKVDLLVNWMERFSSYRKLIRSLAYVVRFVTVKSDRQRGPITSAEFRRSNLRCIHLLQRYYYPDGCEKDKYTANLLTSLNVFKYTTEEIELLRVGGRLRHSSLPYHEKHPLLLPRRCHFNNLLIDYYHLLHLHAGPTTLVAAIQRRYWIPSCRSLVKQRQSKCMACFKRMAKPAAPYMGELPASRFRTERAFIHTGIDYAGPFTCRDTSRRKTSTSKAYMCLFVCLSTKAVHIEIAPNLSTEAFLDCLDKFVSRRGLPAKILSDCGTNFVGAANYLQDLQQWHNNLETQTSIINHTAPLGIEWAFNPPRAPHFGGLWEAAVKSAKVLLYRTIGNHPFSERELHLLCVKIEAILNSRPLTPLTTDLDSLDHLTPGHFLIGGPLSALPEVDLMDTAEGRLSRWQFLRQRLQFFWKRWRYEYLQTLQKRVKWLKRGPEVQIGDLVLITDLNLPALQWPLARIMDVHPGEDGIVRVATVKSSGGIYKRPIVKLVQLPSEI